VTDIRRTLGTQLVFCDTGGDFSPTAANDIRRGSPTAVQMALASLANGAARQSAKATLDATYLPDLVVASAVLEFAATPTAGNGFRVYWAPSNSSTAGTGNPGGVSGSDAAYTGYSSNLDPSLRHLVFVGRIAVTAQATATVQVIRNFASFVPGSRYGSLVVVNDSGAAIHSDDVECHITLDPVYYLTV
jgi:hypothetical protein